MDWTTLSIGLGSILLGGFSTYLAFKERTSSFQENIHAKQVEAILKIIEIIQFPFVIAVSIVFFAHKNQEDEVEDLVSSAREHTVKLLEESVGSQNDLILPAKIIDLKNGLVNNLFEIITQRKKLTLDEKFGLINQITSDRLNLIKECRKVVGTDELSEKNIKLFKSSGDIKEMFSKIGNFNGDTTGFLKSLMEIFQ